MPRTLEQRQAEAERLLRQGCSALAQGQRQRAYELLQRAAMLNPHDEALWLALAQVVERTEDRRVCWENVLAINPHNAQAREELERSIFYPPIDADTASAPVPRPRQSFGQALRRAALWRAWLAAGLATLLALAALLAWLALR
ncbi:MAG: hypothetical protein NZ750_14270 [Anaerolineae bacterium]|nr:hypothetical protein [Anaerolineae bacterium]MDW8173768.1 hypothetical protein [Anaerolineae bacterium]